MIRVILFLVLVGVAALGAAWLADRPGDVTITWLGWHIETSVMVLTAGVAAVAIVAVLLWSLVRMILRSPDLVAMFLRNRRGARGYQAVSKGLVAIGSGDVQAARRHAQEAQRFAPGDPLVLLLNAQTAQLSGDRATAERTFRVMAGRKDTKLLGLRGLFVEAQRRDDPASARAYAEEAARTAPRLAWASQAVFDSRCAMGDWTGALAALDTNFRRGGLVDKAGYRRQRAVLLTAQALADNTLRDQAKALVLEAVRLAPTLVPAVVFAARLCAEGGELRKASRMLEKAWRADPHPDIADAYAHLRFGDSTHDRLRRVEALAQKMSGNLESALALARAALEAQEFEKARAALAPFVVRPTQRVALLMAQLERTEHGDEGRAREWTARAVHAARDAAWTADGFVSDRWLPVSPVTGRVDAFEWKVPLTVLADNRPVIENEDELAPVDLPRAVPVRPATPSVEAAAAHAEPAPAGADNNPVAGVQASPTVPELRPIAAEAKPGATDSRPAVPLPPRKPEAVIPLVHAPDDPGPDSETERVLAPPPPPDGWMRRLFK